MELEEGGEKKKKRKRTPLPPRPHHHPPLFQGFRGMPACPEPPFFSHRERRRKTLLIIDPTPPSRCANEGIDFCIRSRLVGLVVSSNYPHLLRSIPSCFGTDACQGLYVCVTSLLVLKDDSILLQLGLQFWPLDF